MGATAHAAILDRWSVVCRGLEHPGRPDFLPKGERSRHVMCNYFGIGVDASVALDFHQMRERSPHLFVSRFVNKIWYVKSGTQGMLNRMDLASKVTLECDGEPVTVPSDVEGIIVLNIDSFGGGSDVWGNADHSDKDDDDAASDINSSDSD